MPTPPERDFYETYLPQFEAAVREGHVGAVMGAYNSVYGEPACANPLLLTRLLRGQWGFAGHVVSDCGAINDIYRQPQIRGYARGGGGGRGEGRRRFVLRDGLQFADARGQGAG